MSKRESEEEAIARVAARKEKPLKGDIRKLLGLYGKSVQNK